MSDWLEPQFLDHLLGVSAFSAPSALYLGLSTDSGGGFGDDGTGTESSLARQSISFSAPSNSSISSSAAAAIEFPRITGSAETIYGWGVFDAETAGNLLYYGSFPASSISLSTGDSFTVPAGSVSIGVSGTLQPYAFKAWSNHCLRSTSWTMPSVLYLALDRTGSSVGPASASFSTLGGSFDEPRWHDWSTGTVTHSSSGTADQQNARVRAGVINGSGETYGGYQRCRLVYNAATSAGSASLSYSVTRDDGRWYNDQSRNSNWDSTNSRRQNTGKTELRKWTDRVEFPIAGNSYPVVGAASTPPYGSGVGYRTLDSWSVLTGSGVVTGSYPSSSGEQYGTITGWGIFDAETPQTGNLLMRGTFASNIDATASKDVVRIPALSYTVTAA